MMNSNVFLFVFLVLNLLMGLLTGCFLIRAIKSLTTVLKGIRFGVGNLASELQEIEDIMLAQEFTEESLDYDLDDILPMMKEK